MYDAVKIITGEKIGDVGTACQLIVDRVKAFAKPLNVKRAEFLSIGEYGIAFSRIEDIIEVDSIPYAFVLRDHHKNTNIAYEDLLQRDVSHEKGHYELKEQGIEPYLSKDEELYARFEDYAISRFKPQLSPNRETHT